MLAPASRPGCRVPSPPRDISPECRMGSNLATRQTSPSRLRLRRLWLRSYRQYAPRKRIRWSHSAAINPLALRSRFGLAPAAQPTVRSLGTWPAAPCATSASQRLSSNKFPRPKNRGPLPTRVRPSAPPATRREIGDAGICCFSPIDPAHRTRTSAVNSFRSAVPSPRPDTPGRMWRSGKCVDRRSATSFGLPPRYRRPVAPR